MTWIMNIMYMNVYLTVIKKLNNQFDTLAAFRFCFILTVSLICMSVS